MDWNNIYGVIVIAVFMIPNIIYAIKCKKGFENQWHNKTVEIIEQIGRFGCIVFMVINIPYTCFGFWFNGALAIYIAVNAVLTAAYCAIWAICFHGCSLFKALVLSILPSVIFLFSGIMIMSIPLIISAVIFAPCHVLISYKNYLGKEN